MQFKFTFQRILCLMTVLFFSIEAMAQISIPNAAFTDAQDFSTLANSGTSLTVPTGWAFSESGANQNLVYTAGTGSSNAGDTYSFGLAAPSTERAFGGLQSGSLIPTIGVCYTNNTGAIITGLTVTYTGETWRVGNANRSDGIGFQYNQSTTGIGGAGTWTSFLALDYINPGQAVGSGSMLHSALISSPISGLNIAPGATFCFRWNDLNASGADDGIGIDDYSLTNIIAPSPCDAITPLPCGVNVAPSLTGTGFWNTSFCGNSTVGSEAVYSFTPTMTGVHTLVINGVAGDPIDFGYKPVSDGCSSTGWNCIGTSTGTSEITFGPLTAGVQYYILLDAHTTVFSAQNFRIRCEPVPANDLCANAITIPGVNANICGTTLGANADTPNGGVDCPAGGSADANGAGVWYTFVGTGQTWDFFFPENGATWDPEVNVYSGSCGALTCVTGDDDGGGGLSAQFTVNSVAGTTYYVYVHPADDFGGGTSNFCFDVTLSGPPPPVNDLCANAQLLICGDFLTGTTIGAGDDIVNGQAPNCDGGATAGGVWYRFVGDGGTYVVNTCIDADYDTKIAVYTGPCGSLTCVGSNNDFCGSSSNVVVPTVNGTTYRVLVYGNAQTGNFAVQLNCIPANGSATVACPALAVPPTPPVVLGPCGPLAIVGPTITDNPNPLTCEGTRTYTYSYDDTCGPSLTGEDTGERGAGFIVVATWSFVYTIERLPFTIVPALDTMTVRCPALAVAPAILPTVTSNCGEVLTPTGPVITNTPNPITCEGTRDYVYTYTDCEGNTATYTKRYFIERIPFTVPANGAATVACLANAVAPTLPIVTSNCGETLTPAAPVITDNPNPLTCEGTRTYAYTYTDCEGNTGIWSFVYTIERQPFSLPANGAATVACPALATQPVPPVVASNCSEVLTPTGPVITDVPNPLTCEGTRTYTWTYTDCEGNTATWSFVYTIERQPFTVPANGAAQVACPALATQPVPPVVTSNCGEVLTPTGPVVTNNPNPLTCEGTRTYTWTYTDCEGNTATWSFVYTIEREPFTIPVPNGNANVDCPDDTDLVPTPPVVTSNCGEVLTPVITSTPKNACEGDRVYYFTYTDCEGNTAVWQFNYRIEYLDFTVPASEVVSVECPVNAILPTPPVVFDNCGNLLNPAGPVITTLPNAFGCDGSRTFAWTYTDCEGNTHTWSKRYNFLYSGDFFAPANEVNVVSCLAYAVAPFPQVLFDFCGQEIQVSGPTMTQNISANGCTGTRTYSFVYRDCGGRTRPWTFTYIIEDNQAPVGTCPSGNSPVSVDVTNLACIEDVPCPDDYNFNSKIQELLAAGNYYDVCYGSQVFVTLVDDSGLWECSDPDGDGDFTFGRTFYFRITDRCGNAHPSLCEVTYSGACQPLETFSMAEWGVEGGAPGNTVSGATTDLSVITTLLGSGPVAIGGANRSITVNDAQCMMNLLPGTGGPAILANCQQVNCTGCNPLGIGGLKNALAANALALELNIRYNVQYNGLNRTNIRNQHLNCISLHPCIYTCDANGNCRVKFFDAAGNELTGVFSIGGLQDLVNIYLNASNTLTTGQKVIYGTALNQSLLELNSYFNSQAADACDDVAPDFSEIDKLFNDYNLDFESGNVLSKDEPSLEIVPNPASSDVNIRLTDIAENAEVSLEIINALGQKVMVRKFGAVGFLNEKLDLNGLGNGIYLVSVKAGETRFEQKLVVARD